MKVGLDVIYTFLANVYFVGDKYLHNVAVTDYRHELINKCSTVGHGAQFVGHGAQLVGHDTQFVGHGAQLAGHVWDGRYISNIHVVYPGRYLI